MIIVSLHKRRCRTHVTISPTLPYHNSGDSGAAGHGNFFSEQYTLILQEKAAGLFASVGLNFVARPFAMHSSTSAPEVAACVKEIFGTDVDIFAWDFAMTDGRWHWRLEFFGHRVMLLPNHPTMLVLRAELDSERKSTVEHLVAEGMGAMRLDEAYMSSVKAKFPDSHYHSNVESLPDHVRYFRCGHTIESGPGGCIENKFTHNGTCDDREGQTNWHHGWYVMIHRIRDSRVYSTHPHVLQQEMACLPWESLCAVFDGDY